MNLKIFLPFKIFIEKSNVIRIIAVTPEGSYGLLPHRLDCVATLSPGILIYETKEEGEVFLAIDAGILVKTGPDVNISVRRALGGMPLDQLRHEIEKEFLTINEYEKNVRSVMAKLETGFLRRFTRFQHD